MITYLFIPVNTNNYLSRLQIHRIKSPAFLGIYYKAIYFAIKSLPNLGLIMKISLSLNKLGSLLAG